jgi:hypothetical protein
MESNWSDVPSSPQMPRIDSYLQNLETGKEVLSHTGFRDETIPDLGLLDFKIGRQ